MDRSRRRRARESRDITNHHEGLSSDDEESQTDISKFNLEKGINTLRTLKQSLCMHLE